VQWIEINGPTVVPEEAVALKWLRLVCPGQKVKVRAKPSVKEPATGMLNNGDEIEVYSKLVGGFYQLNDDKVFQTLKCFCIVIVINSFLIQGYVNKNTQGVEWIDIDGPTKRPEAVETEDSIKTKWVRMICPGQKVKLRSLPDVSLNEITALESGTEIEVFVTPINGFYKLTGDKVCHNFNFL
jgi:hypothetical protein